MYQTYFGFAAAPFTIAPDPRYLYMSQRHQEALATLLYGLRSEGGFVLLTGEVGAGKTTLCRCLLEQIPDTFDVAYLFNPRLTVTELLSTICDEFGIDYPPGTRSIKKFIDRINEYLLAAHARGRRAVLIIDEAQNLSPPVLEQIRLLTNLETSECKLLQILLLGQPELQDMLERPELLQLAQRIVARYHLMPLDRPEVAAYVRHRLEVAGAFATLFPPGIMGELHRLSGGVPRVINVLCDRSLLGAFVQGKERIDRDILRQAAREVLPPGPLPGQFRLRGALAGAALVLAGAAGILALLPGILFPTAVIPTSAIPGTPVANAPATGAPVTRAPLPGQAAGQQAAAPALPASGAAAQAAPRIFGLPPDITGAQSQQLAFATLFHKWHAAYHSGEDPCAQAAAQGMRCRTLHGGLVELRKLNTPAILHLTDDAGRPFYALLTALRARSATFSFGAQIRQVSLDALARQWQGEYTVLLRVPQGLSEQSPRTTALAYWNGARRVATEGGH